MQKHCIVFITTPMCKDDVWYLYSYNDKYIRLRMFVVAFTLLTIHKNFAGTFIMKWFTLNLCHPLTLPSYSPQAISSPIAFSFTTKSLLVPKVLACVISDSGASLPVDISPPYCCKVTRPPTKTLDEVGKSKFQAAATEFGTQILDLHTAAYQMRRWCYSYKNKSRRSGRSVQVLYTTGDYMCVSSESTHSKCDVNEITRCLVHIYIDCLVHIYNQLPCSTSLLSLWHTMAFLLSRGAIMYGTWPTTILRDCYNILECACPSSISICDHL